MLTANALELLAALQGTFGPRRAELLEARAVRDAELAGGALPDFLPETVDVREGDVRPRGWHLPEWHLLVDGEPMSGSLFDFGRYMTTSAQVALADDFVEFLTLPAYERIG